MYRVKSIMGDTVFQVIKEPNVIIQNFYTESVAKEFCDRLTAYEYFERFERFVYPIAYDEPFNETIKNKAYNQALEDFEKALEKHQQDNWIDNLEYGITFDDVEEVIKQLKK